MVGWSKPRIKRLCKRIGCTETWYATEKDPKRYCRGCIPQSSSGPIYPYRVRKLCDLCSEAFTIEVHSEKQRKIENTCSECKAVLNSREWKCMRLIVESGIRPSAFRDMKIETIDWLYEELEGNK